MSIGPLYDAGFAAGVAAERERNISTSVVDDAMIKRAMKAYGETPLANRDWMRIVLTAALKLEA